MGSTKVNSFLKNAKLQVRKCVLSSTPDMCHTLANSRSKKFSTLVGGNVRQISLEFLTLRHLTNAPKTYERFEFLWRVKYLDPLIPFSLADEGKVEIE